MEEKKDLADLLYENRRLAVAAVAVVVLVVLAYGLFSHMRQKKVERASYYFGKALENLLAYEGSTNATSKLKDALVLFKKAEAVGAGREAELARLMEGRVLVLMGKVDEGTRLIKESLSTLDGSYFEPIFVVQSLDEGELKRYLAKENPFLEDYVRFQLAMLMLEKGDKKSAVSELETVKGKFPDSPFAMDARVYLGVIK